MSILEISGTSFELFKINEVDWNEVAGVYVFLKENAKNWSILYIGQASSLKERLSNHERIPDAKRLGLTHIAATVVRLQSNRDRLEKDLIQQYQPPMNTQLK